MDIENLQRNLPVLIVVLLTWGGVFLYLLRVERLTRNLENRINESDDAAPGTTEDLG